MKNDGADFFDVITNDFKTVPIPADGLCSDGIKAAFLALDALKTTNTSWPTMKADYKLCDDVTKAQDI